MNAIPFSQSPRSPYLYVADPHAALVLPRGADTSAPTLTLGDQVGCVFFSAEPISDDVSFTDAAQFFMDTHPGARIAWGNTVFLGVSADGQVDRVTTFAFGGLTLLIGRGGAVGLDDDGFTITPAGDGSAALLTPAGRLHSIAGALTIPISGAESGSIHFHLALGAGEIAHLRPQMRLFAQFEYESDNAAVRDFWKRGATFFLDHLDYPLFPDDLPALNLYPALHPLDAKRSYFGFVHPVTGAKDTAVASCYRTTLGYTVHLTPVDFNSRLIFAPAPSAQTPGPVLYLVPSGDFELTVPRYNPNAPMPDFDNVLCGLSGVEYVKIDPEGGTRLRFVPGGKAYSPPTGALTDLASTAWAYIPGSLYYAQPDQSVLYETFRPTADDLAANPQAATADPRADFLHYLEVPVTGLPAVDGASFPMMPYGGIDDSQSDDYQTVELKVISPARRGEIERVSARDTTPLGQNGNGRTGATPQGLLAQFSQQFENWDSLMLARDTDGIDLKLVDIDRHDSLRAALQSNQLFLVATRPEALAKHFSNPASGAPINQLTIAGWTFDLNPASWSQFGTILIFKFFDRPLVDLLDDTTTWAQPDTFNASKENTRRRVVKLIQDALAKSPEIEDPNVSRKDQDNYQKLAYAARTRTWSGVIALNVTVPPSGFPPALQGLAAGIDLSKFYAQYAGIEMTPVKAEDGQLLVGTSSLFGLIDYNDLSAPPPNDSGYNFRVTNLSALFRNSQIKDFSSEIAVTLDKLFEEAAVLRDRPGDRNDLILKGRYESHNGQSAYSFTFSGSNIFDLPESAVLNHIEIVKAQFTTSQPANPDGFADGDTVIGRFGFWGRLDFKALANQRGGKFDILSFGAEADESGASSRFLSFSNLALDMSFVWGNVAETRTFTFDASRIAFDRLKSQSRVQSLYSKFPLKLTGFVAGDANTTADSLGYMPVKTPLGGSAPKDGIWYGLTFDLELGDVGALAGKAGIVVSLLAAWAPGGEGAVYTGLRLPGSTGGKKEISLMGVLKLVFKRIEFTADEDGGGSMNYILKLKNVMLKFMVLSLPPNGQTEIIIFGDPQGTQENNTLGWYAAYAKNTAATQAKPAPKDMFGTPSAGGSPSLPSTTPRR